jgi:hypothetical protein
MEDFYWMSEKQKESRDGQAIRYDINKTRIAKGPDLR